MKGFAPVAPLAIHKELANWGLLGDYHLLLAHQVLSDPQGYAAFWRGRLDQFVIMDNSAAEFGESLPFEDVVQAARIVEAQVIVLPDVIGDTNRTLAGAGKVLADRPVGFGLLGVAQGRTFDDVLYCASTLADWGVQLLSIPRGVTFDVGSRVSLVRAAELFKLPIHLLGFSNDLVDDFASAIASPNVIGIDSAVPLWLNQPLANIPTEHADFGKRPGDYDKWEQLPNFAMAQHNLRTVRSWLGDVSAARTDSPASSAHEDPNPLD